jgi:hypothetical protein
VVLAKRESDPVVPVALALLLDGLDVSLLLEHLGVLGHVLGGLERVEIADVGVAVQDRHERRGCFT